MLDFTVELRHYCRYPRCRTKLKTPVENSREAFCCRGCYSSFYLNRCLICEGPLRRKSSTRKVCRKSKCRNAFRTGSALGRYHASTNARSGSKTPDSIDPKLPPKSTRAWRIVAGPKLSPRSLHAATVPDGPDGCWEGGQYEHYRAPKKHQLQRHHPPVNILGGYKFPGAPNINIGDQQCNT
jgi:hypothetical protein